MYYSSEYDNYVSNSGLFRKIHGQIVVAHIIDNVTMSERAVYSNIIKQAIKDKINI